jgi:hypothetical protein
MTVITRRNRWRAAANERIRQTLAVRRAALDVPLVVASNPQATK